MYITRDNGYQIFLFFAQPCDYECSKTCKIDKYLGIKNCSCVKRLFGKLVLACDSEILSTTDNNTTEMSNKTSVDDKKSNMWKKLLSCSHDFIGNYMLIIISCHFY